MESLTAGMDEDFMGRNLRILVRIRRAEKLVLGTLCCVADFIGMILLLEHEGGMTYGEVLDMTFNCVTTRRYFMGMLDD